MKTFDESDRVRIDIPDTTDPDHDQYHGVHGTIVEVLHDDAKIEAGDDIDAQLYRIEFDDGEIAEFRGWDLRHPIE